jgi:hypothetical protein
MGWDCPKVDIVEHCIEDDGGGMGSVQSLAFLICCLTLTLNDIDEAVRR